jgi:import receptor subunit TOM70
MSANSEKIVEKAPATAPEKLKKFFEDKDWKFYCALAAGLTLAGAGAYYMTSGNKKPKSKPESKEAKREAQGT